MVGEEKYKIVVEVDKSELPKFVSSIKGTNKEVEADNKRLSKERENEAKRLNELERNLRLAHLEDERRTAQQQKDLWKQINAEILKDKQRISDQEKAINDKAVRNLQLATQNNKQRISDQEKAINDKAVRNLQLATQNNKQQTKIDSKFTGQSVTLGSKQSISEMKSYLATLSPLDAKYKQLASSIKGYEQALRSASGVQRMSKAQLLEFGENLTVVVTGLVKLASQTKETILSGAEFGVMKKKFEEFNGGVDEAKKKLDLLRTASTGNLDDKSLIQYSNKMQLLGFTSEETAKFLDIVERKSDEVGVSFETGQNALEQFIISGRGRGLKELGINIAEVDSKVQQLIVSSGKNKESLTEEEQQYFRNKAIVELYGNSIQEISKKTQDNADKVKGLESAWSNFKNTLGGEVANTLSSTNGNFSKLTDTLNGVAKAIGFVIKEFNFFSMTGGILDTIEDLGNAFTKWSYSISLVPDSFKQVVAGWLNLKSVIESNPISANMGVLQAGVGTFDKGVGVGTSTFKQTGKGTSGTRQEKNDTDDLNKSLLEEIQNKLKLLDLDALSAKFKGVGKEGRLRNEAIFHGAFRGQNELGGVNPHQREQDEQQRSEAIWNNILSVGGQMDNFFSSMLSKTGLMDSDFGKIFQMLKEVLGVGFDAVGFFGSVIGFLTNPVGTAVGLASGGGRMAHIPNINSGGGNAINNFHFHGELSALGSWKSMNKGKSIGNTFTSMRSN